MSGVWFGERPHLKQRSFVRCSCFSPDGKTIASASSDNTVQLRLIEVQRLVQTLKSRTKKVRSEVYAPDGKTFASASDD